MSRITAHNIRGVTNDYSGTIYGNEDLVEIITNDNLREFL